MIYLLSREGREALRVVAKHSRILFAFDFDGTLAGISPDREGVKLSPSTHGWLHELASRVPCAIVSGRALGDLRPRVNGAVTFLIGNHGLESPLTPAAALGMAERVCLEWMTRLETDLAHPFKDTGAEVENKRYSLTVHYRETDEADRVQQALVLLLNRLTPAPRLLLGRESVNVLPPGSRGKGEASLAMMSHLRCTGLFFVGDDETDEDVFGLKEGLIMGVRVGPKPESRARYYLKHQSEMEDVIQFLVHRIDRTPESADEDEREAGRSSEAANEF
jgi:trehalose 6-phosphate phosphatase